MAPLTFPINAIMEWDNQKITDHNRDPLDVSVERIELVKRMANGTLRKYVVTDKRTFSASWSDLPHIATYTVDGFYGGREIEAFYAAHRGGFDLKLTYGDGTNEVIPVVFSKFSKTITKRSSVYELWNVDVELTEI